MERIFTTQCVGCEREFTDDLYCCCDDAAEQDGPGHENGYCKECCPQHGTDPVMDEDEFEDFLVEDDEDDEIMFADPGGESALRAGVREFPCPNCLEPNRLTAEDVRLGYQCDRCSDQQERGF